MFRRLGTLVALALVAGGVSSAAGQQAPQNCLGSTPTMVGTPGDDTLAGTAGRDVINGLQGNDTIDGGAGPDVICGGDGDDTVLGNTGLDAMSGGLGNDRIDGGAGGGFNGVVYVEAPGAVTVDLTAGTATGSTGNDTLVNINTVLGSRKGDVLKGGPGQDLLLGLGGGDTLVGAGGPDILAGLGGNDSLDGGAGFDYADYSDAPFRIQANLTRGTAFGDGRDRLRRMEGVIGGARGDKLIGNNRDNELFGDRGNDTSRAVAAAISFMAAEGVTTSTAAQEETAAARAK
jgi:Ca2+-binding RTX toxin-like protein